jgi:hypothetical protein
MQRRGARGRGTSSACARGAQLVPYGRRTAAVASTNFRHSRARSRCLCACVGKRQRGAASRRRGNPVSPAYWRPSDRGPLLAGSVIAFIVDPRVAGRVLREQSDSRVAAVLASLLPRIRASSQRELEPWCSPVGFCDPGRRGARATSDPAGRGCYLGGERGAVQRIRAAARPRPASPGPGRDPSDRNARVARHARSGARGTRARRDLARGWRGAWGHAAAAAFAHLGCPGRTSDWLGEPGGDRAPALPGDRLAAARSPACR